MKKSLFIIALLTPLFIYAQKLTAYKAINGITYHIGDTVRLGLGSSASGTFTYLQMGGWGAAMSYEPNAGPDQLNIGRGYANTAVIIKKIKASKINGIVKYWFIVGGGNLTNYNLMIDDAIQVCEVIPCQSNSPVILQQASDNNLDKLKKLKALLDSGAITQAEYDEHKKKLLNQ
ncbi:MAG: hypothetical protein JWP44_1326 [Mucilaginibacter sp.]|nr:hypothetical protein [Mucilaginibacter sp.]